MKQSEHSDPRNNSDRSRAIAVSEFPDWTSRTDEGRSFCQES